VSRRYPTNRLDRTLERLAYGPIASEPAVDLAELAVKATEAGLSVSFNERGDLLAEAPYAPYTTRLRSVADIVSLDAAFARHVARSR
jgi:hypothetical protein